KFSESYWIRKEQHLEMKRYAERILAEGIQRNLGGFTPDYFSIADYEASLYPYRRQVIDFFGCNPPGTREGKITRFEQVGEDRYSTVYRVWVEVIDSVHAYGIYMVPKKIRGK